jgi:hypothetical protein
MLHMDTVTQWIKTMLTAYPHMMSHGFELKWEAHTYYVTHTWLKRMPSQTHIYRGSHTHHKQGNRHTHHDTHNYLYGGRGAF